MGQGQHLQEVVIIRSNPVSPDPRVEKIARALHEKGYRVKIVGWDRTGGFSPFEKRAYAEVYRIFVGSMSKHGLGNLPYLIRWQFALTSWLLANHRNYQLIHACDFDTVIPALLMKFLFRKRVVYDIFDFYADMLLKTPSWICKLIRTVDVWTISKADWVILADESRLKQIRGARPRRVEIIYNSPDPTFLRAGDRKVPERSGELVISYVGLISEERGLLYVLKILSNHPEWKMRLAGIGDERIIQMARQMSNVHFYGRVDYQKALEIENQADVLFATYDPRIPNHKYSSPNKFFEAMMLGKPIVVAQGTGVDELVQRYELGFVVEYGNLMELQNAFRVIASWEPSKRKEFAAHARYIYVNYFSWDIMKERLVKIYDSLLDCS